MKYTAQRKYRDFVMVEKTTKTKKSPIKKLFSNIIKKLKNE